MLPLLSKPDFHAVCELTGARPLQHTPEPRQATACLGSVVGLRQEEWGSSPSTVLSAAPGLHLSLIVRGIGTTNSAEALSSTCLP